MANRNTQGFGLVPAGTLGSTPATSGQGKYKIDAGYAVTQAGFLETYDMNTSAGSTTTGKSSATLDIGDTSADAASWRLLRSAEDPENEDITAAFASVVVVPNLIELQS